MKSVSHDQAASGGGWRADREKERKREREREREGERQRQRDTYIERDLIMGVNYNVIRRSLSAPFCRVVSRSPKRLSCSSVGGHDRLGEQREREREREGTEVRDGE